MFRRIVSAVIALLVLYVVGSAASPAFGATVSFQDATRVYSGADHPSVDSLASSTRG